MNLQEIQNRMAELSAEMLDLSIQMATIISGKVGSRGRTIGDWSQLTSGDQVNISESFIPPYSEGKVKDAGKYIVVSLEDTNYEGKLSVQIKPQIGYPFWINAQDMIRLGILTKI